MSPRPIGLLFFTMAACGSTPSPYPTGTGSSGSANTFADPTDGPAATSNGGDSVTSCVTSSAPSNAVPAYLVFMMDRSCSMSDVGKWGASKQALDSFFADASTAGLNASLDFFPRVADSCATSDYASPTVAMQTLPAGAAFQSAIDSSPLVCGTPTLPAFQGALAYAQSVAAQHPDSKVAIVLVTDGLPDTCSSTVESVASAASATAATIPTYVIGVGDALTELNAIAAGGGTGSALLVSTTSPQQIAQDLRTALGAVKASAGSCEYSLPAPPAGSKLDTNKVNVVYTPAGGSATTIAYDASCAGGVGWRYDNAAAPTKIVMCPSTCSTLEAAAGAGVRILFGCTTNATVK